MAIQLTRPMLVEDIPAVLDVWQSCEGVGLSEGDTPEGLAAFLTRNPGMSWVACYEGTRVGAVLAGHDGRRGFLYHLAVREGSRRSGIGTLLVERALASLRHAGIVKCHLMVFRNNNPASEFWTRKGWLKRADIDVHTIVGER